MMFIKLLLLLFLSLELTASIKLKSEYTTYSDEIRLSSLFLDPKEDILLYTITPGRYTKKVPAQELLDLLQKHGYNNLTTSSQYIQFTKQAILDLSFIETELKKIFTERYKEIDITEITIQPRGYLNSLASSYSVHLQGKSHLKSKGTLYIKTEDGKKIFFDFHIKARLNVYFARENIKKNRELSALNAIKKSIILDKFQAQPVQNVTNGTMQSKHTIKKGTLLTTRDIVELELVRRGEMINVSLESDNLSISFSAEALESGVYEQIIEVQKQNGVKLKIRVSGKNRGEAI